MSNFAAFSPADILVPAVKEPEKWSVVACDQYTSQPEYWRETADIVGDAPSALNLVFPEIYLKDADFDARINRINEHMNRYMSDGIFRGYSESYFYIERTMANGKVRRGLIGKIDLTQYDYNKGSESLIRATEGTVLERIPPRVKIRENALLELPHVMLLIDDRADKVMSHAAERKDKYELAYDFCLMQNGGRVRGWKLDEYAEAFVDADLKDLADPGAFEKKYGVTGKKVLQFAVGDGNHSLATAKECYNRLTAHLTPEEALNHPARYALVELVNLHDPALEFEAIHRVVFGVNPEHLLNELFKRYECVYAAAEGQRFDYVTKDKCGTITVKNPASALAVGTLQLFLDDYLARFGGRIDYIHGKDVTESLAREDGNIGFILPAMEKPDLFRTVILDGALPRKTFSMGEACEKRFYLEARRIR
ncbi:DUF1015 domain-containing protein [Acetanaerobacterium elongatum]|uniref:DUF1015 domain-containing protein n=1 Tax=Acetanaerobacterium elongatum TaxID=258515 RepID=A0A1H0E146_9FIRM|nr:DUF1015 domain-containing protein [Acetanaerobacterium elongatum]SDN76006.1 Protein of unknown function [Acetanaerobacterium elongatum]